MTDAYLRAKQELLAAALARAAAEITQDDLDGYVARYAAAVQALAAFPHMELR